MAGAFAIDLSRIVEKAKGQTELVIRKVMLEAFTSVVQMSPVDTGRFKGAWQVGYGAPNTRTDSAADKAGSATIGRISSDVATVRIGGGSIFLTNALPYSIRLENGYSKQAPAGMVAVTMARISARYGA